MSSSSSDEEEEQQQFNNGTTGEEAYVSSDDEPTSLKNLRELARKEDEEVSSNNSNDDVSDEERARTAWGSRAANFYGDEFDSDSDYESLRKGGRRGVSAMTDMELQLAEAERVKMRSLSNLRIADCSLVAEDLAMATTGGDAPKEEEEEDEEDESLLELGDELDCSSTSMGWQTRVETVLKELVSTKTRKQKARDLVEVMSPKLHQMLTECQERIAYFKTAISPLMPLFISTFRETHGGQIDQNVAKLLQFEIRVYFFYFKIVTAYVSMTMCRDASLKGHPIDTIYFKLAKRLCLKLDKLTRASKSHQAARLKLFERLTRGQEEREPTIEQSEDPLEVQSFSEDDTDETKEAEPSSNDVEENPQKLTEEEWVKWADTPAENLDFGGESEEEKVLEQLYGDRPITSSSNESNDSDNEAQDSDGEAQDSAQDSDEESLEGSGLNSDAENLSGGDMDLLSSEEGSTTVGSDSDEMKTVVRGLLMNEEGVSKLSKVELACMAAEKMRRKQEGKTRGPENSLAQIHDMGSTLMSLMTEDDKKSSKEVELMTGPVYSGLGKMKMAGMQCGGGETIDDMKKAARRTLARQVLLVKSGEVKRVQRNEAMSRSTSVVEKRRLPSYNNDKQRRGSGRAEETTNPAEAPPMDESGERGDRENDQTTEESKLQAYVKQLKDSSRQKAETKRREARERALARLAPEEPRVADDEKRRVSNTIEQNRGLVRKRKKFEGHARVHNRIKYAKKMKKMTGVREAAREGSESGHYGGESSGILTHVVKSRRYG